MSENSGGDPVESSPIIITESSTRTIRLKKRAEKEFDRQIEKKLALKVKREKSSESASQELRKPFFSDETMRRLIWWLKGKKILPVTLSPNGKPATETPENLQEELAAALRDEIRPWGISIFLHACVSLVLALLFLEPNLKRNDEIDVIISELGHAMSVAVEGPLMGSLDAPMDQKETYIVRNDGPEVDQPIAVPNSVETTPDGAEAVTISENTVAGAVDLSIDGREIGSRVVIGHGEGPGPGASDGAVALGLRWLVQKQSPEGSWSLTGVYRDPARKEYENRNAATALALLALQGFGVTPMSKPKELAEFSRAVEKGSAWLLKQQDSEGSFFRIGTGPRNDRFYTHALCTIAICELYAMTKNDAYREPSQKAIDYLVKYQSKVGGWRYEADIYSDDADLSVTGWVLLALKTGQMAKLQIPNEPFERIVGFLDTVSRDEGSQYVYQNVRGENPKPSMTAEGLFCRQLLGWTSQNASLTRGAEILSSEEYLPSYRHKRDVYAWYYASLALRHYGGEPWKIWNDRMLGEILKHQEKDGTERGSWNPNLPSKDEWGTHYGRLYTTCLTICILEVYYRHELRH